MNFSFAAKSILTSSVADSRSRVLHMSVRTLLFCEPIKMFPSVLHVASDPMKIT